MPGPFDIDVIGLGRRPGSMLPVQRSFPSPVRIGRDLIAIAEGAEVTVDLQLQSVSEGVLVTGTVSGPLSGECSRCLEPITGEVDGSITELFAYPDSVTEATTDEDEIPRIVDGMIYLEQTVIDVLAPDIDSSPLCRADCPGLCPECGIALATVTSNHHHDRIDSRWAKLGELRDGQ